MVSTLVEMNFNELDYLSGGDSPERGTGQGGVAVGTG